MAFSVIVNFLILRISFVLSSSVAVSRRHWGGALCEWGEYLDIHGECALPAPADQMRMMRLETRIIDWTDIRYSVV